MKATIKVSYITNQGGVIRNREQTIKVPYSNPKGATTESLGYHLQKVMHHHQFGPGDKIEIVFSSSVGRAEQSPLRTEEERRVGGRKEAQGRRWHGRDTDGAF